MKTRPFFTTFLITRTACTCKRNTDVFKKLNMRLKSAYNFFFFAFVSVLSVRHWYKTQCSRIYNFQPPERKTTSHSSTTATTISTASSYSTPKTTAAASSGLTAPKTTTTPAVATTSTTSTTTTNSSGIRAYGGARYGFT